MARATKRATRGSKNQSNENQQTPVAAAVTAATQGKLPPGVKATRVITLPVLVLKESGSSAVIIIGDKMRVSNVEGKPAADGTKQKPATVCAVTKPETGEQFIYIVPAVVEKNLKDNYPDDGYVGKTFYIENLGKRKQGQRYNDFRIMECEYDAAAAEAAGRTD